MSDWYDPRLIAENLGEREPDEADPHSADIHIWCEPADEVMTAVYTISEGRRAIAVKAPRDLALQMLSEFLDELAGDQG